MNAPDRAMVDPFEPPHSVESEQCVLGAILIDNNALDRIIDSIGESDFFRSDHRAIWRTIIRVIEDGKSADVITVFEALGNKADEVGGLSYINQLQQNTPSAANVKGYAKIVREKSILRGLMSISQEAIDVVVSRSRRSAEDVIADVAMRVDALMEMGAGSEEAPLIGETLTEVKADVQERMEVGAPAWGVRSGLLDLDEKTLGFQPGDLIVIAGRPSMGKTALGMQIAQECAVNGGRVDVYSMEMKRKSLALRMACNLGGVEITTVRRGKMSDLDVSRWHDAYDKLRDTRLRIDDQGALKVAQIRARSRRMKRKHGLDLIVIDYLQLMVGVGDNRTQEIGSISRGLKALAKELNVPVIVLSQLNRGVESRSNKRPMMSDLRESGDIEQDADLILLLYRDEYYDPDTKDLGVAEINIAKQREGEVGTVFAQFEGVYTRFNNLAHYERQMPSAPAKRGFS